MDIETIQTGEGETKQRGSDDAPRNSWLTLVILWLTIMAAYCFVHERKMENQMALSRADLLHALVFQHTFAIDAYHTNTVNKAVSAGHYYCDKAPGTVFLALPSFYLSSKVLGAFGVAVDSPKGWLFSDWITVVTSIGALSALGAVCLFLWLQGFMSPRTSLLCTLVVAFGTVMFPYSTMMLSHGLVIGLLGAALFLLRLGWPPKNIGADARRFSARDFLGGIACGLAIACEYDAALVAGGILAVVFTENFRRGCRLVFGAAVPLSLILFNNWASVGNPFSLPYGHEVLFKQMSTGFYGIHFPDADNFIYLLLSPEQGLFFWTPFLLLAIPGYIFLFKRYRPLFWLCYWAPLLQVAIMSGYFDAAAGATIGARYLSPAIPLLILPAGISAAKMPWVALPLGILSISFISVATFVNYQLPAGTSNPLFKFYIPGFLNDSGNITLGELMGIKKSWSILLVVVATLTGATWLYKRISKYKT